MKIKKMHCIFDSFKFQKNTFGHLSLLKNRIASWEIMPKKIPGFKLLCKKEHPPVEQVPRNPRKTAIFSFHLKLNGTLPTDP